VAGVLLVGDKTRGGVKRSDDGAEGNGHRCIVQAVAAVGPTSFDVKSKELSSAARGEGGEGSGVRSIMSLGMMECPGSIDVGGGHRCFSRSKRAVSSTSCDRVAD